MSHAECVKRRYNLLCCQNKRDISCMSNSVKVNFSYFCCCLTIFITTHKWKLLWEIISRRLSWPVLGCVASHKIIANRKYIAQCTRKLNANKEHENGSPCLTRYMHVPTTHSERTAVFKFSIKSTFHVSLCIRIYCNRRRSAVSSVVYSRMSSFCFFIKY